MNNSENFVKHSWLFSALNMAITRMKIFKQGIGIAEKSQETRIDWWDGNVNHKSLFWFH